MINIRLNSTNVVQESLIRTPEDVIEIPRSYRIYMALVGTKSAKFCMDYDNLRANVGRQAIIKVLIGPLVTSRSQLWERGVAP